MVLAIFFTFILWFSAQRLVLSLVITFCATGTSPVSQQMAELGITHRTLPSIHTHTSVNDCGVLHKGTVVSGECGDRLLL